MSTETGTEADKKSQGVIGYGRHVASNYGAVLDHLEPAMKKYHAVLVVSDYEILHLHELATKEKYDNKQIMDELKNLYPDQAQRLDALDPKSADAMANMVRHISNKYSKTNDGPSAFSMQFGTDKNPTNLGLVFLPERVNVDMGETRAVMGGYSAPRQSKTGFIVAHEFGHLLHDAGKGGVSVTFRNLDQVLATGMVERSEKQVLQGEIASDRFAQQATKGMVKAGLFKDDGIEKDVRDIRNLNSFVHLLQEGELDERGGKKRVINGVHSHSTGFSAGTPKDQEREYERLERAAVPIVQARDKKLVSLFNAAADGKATPAINNAFEISVADPSRNPQEVVKKFREEVFSSPEFRQQFAKELAAQRGLPKDARGIAMDYLEAYKHYESKFNQPAPEAEPPEAETPELEAVGADAPAAPASRPDSAPAIPKAPGR